MAAILLSACTVNQYDVSGWKTVKIETPNTVDAQDTIDVSDLFSSINFGLATGASDLTIPLGNSGAGTALTIPGTTDNETRYIIAWGD